MDSAAPSVAEGVAKVVADAMPGFGVFAILDAARWRNFRDTLDGLGVPSVCLLTGALDPEVRAVAPYLAALPREEEVMDRFLPEMWGDSRGILLTARGGLLDVQKHLRTLLVSSDEDGGRIIVRFYDPRVFRRLAEGTDPHDWRALFGEVVETYVVESPDPGVTLRYKPGQTAPEEVFA